MTIVAATALTAVLTWFSTAGGAIPLLAWIAPAPVLAFAFAGAGRRRLAGKDPAVGRRIRFHEPAGSQ